MSTIKFGNKKEFKCKQTNLFQVNIFKLLLRPFLFFPIAASTPFHIAKFSTNFHFTSSFEMTSTSMQLPIASTRLRSLILKKPISTLYTQMTQENKADPQLTKMILFNIFQLFQLNKINFQQYLILHNHPDTFFHKCDATTQTD